MTALSLRGELIKVAYDNTEARALILPVLSSKVASTQSLKARAIRLAYQYPEIRGLVLPCITKEEARRPSKKKTKQLLKHQKAERQEAGESSRSE